MPRLVTAIVEWAGDPNNKDRLAVMIGLPPDADVTARHAAVTARWSICIAVLALVVSIIALFKDSFFPGPGK